MLNLARDLRIVMRGVERLDSRNSGAALQQAFPRCFRGIADR